MDQYRLSQKPERKKQLLFASGLTLGGVTMWAMHQVGFWVGAACHGTPRGTPSTRWISGHSTLEVPRFPPPRASLLALLSEMILYNSKPHERPDLRSSKAFVGARGRASPRCSCIAPAISLIPNPMRKDYLNFAYATIRVVIAGA
jgi:hypothetical protein